MTFTWPAKAKHGKNTPCKNNTGKRGHNLIIHLTYRFLACFRCHELGHGWGLPHTDENVYNSNRGDCLDLTLNPVGDIQPGSYNFNLLAQMYGTVNGSVNATMINNSTASGTSSFGRTRDLRRGYPRGFLRRLDALPHRALVEARYLSTVKAFGEGNLCDTLTGSKTGCVIDLGHGYTLGAHIFPSDL